MPSASSAAPAICASTWNALKARDFQLLDHLLFLSHSNARRNNSPALYSWPGREWLAAKLRCSVRTITRHTTRLAAAGLLRRVQRRPEHGQWRSNLYVILGAAGRAVAKTRQKLASLLRRGPQLAHKPLYERALGSRAAPQGHPRGP